MFASLVSPGVPPAAMVWVAGWGREGGAIDDQTEAGQAGRGGALLRLDSNENPVGPGARVLEAISGSLGEAGRYPFNASRGEGALVEAIARRHGVKTGQVTLGAGSGEILANAVRAFTSAARPLVTAWPTFEIPHDKARRVGTEVRAVPLDARLRLDVERMTAASDGAGLVYFCNPNNPTATVHGASTVAEFLTRVGTASPDTVVLIDEAYHDYVADPSYETAIATAATQPNIVVTRTFSKAHGMAGVRLGYAIGHASTIERLARYRMPLGANVPAIAGALASLADPDRLLAECVRNAEARAFTVDAFTRLGFETTVSQANFVFVNLRRPTAAFRDACRSAGVRIGRDFAPYERTHCRVSIGTLDEMRHAAEVFRKVLA